MRMLLLAMTFMLSIVGAVMVFSAASVVDAAGEGGFADTFLRQVFWLVLGWIALLVLERVDFRLVGRLWFVLTGFSIFLLSLVFLFPAVKGARRWINLGFASFQPSELAKLFCIISAAYLLSEWRAGRLVTSGLMSRLLISVGIPAVLIMFEPDLGSTVMLLGSVAILVFLAGVPFSFFAWSLAGVGGVAASMIMRNEYQRERLMGFFDPASPTGQGWQARQALLALGSGGFFGSGVGSSKQKYFYLPEAHNDFIFAVIGEEGGLLGTMTVVAGFVAFTYAGIRIALGARERFGRMLAATLTASIAIQAAMNVLSVVGMTPITGKPLPFVSAGGSSMLFAMASVGVILSVARYGARPAGRAQKKSLEAIPGALPDERRRDGRSRLSRVGDRPVSARRRA